MNRQTVRFLAVTCLLGLWLGGLQAHATTLDFNVTTGDWNTASSWSPAQVPTAADHPDIENGGTVTISSVATGGLVWVGITGNGYMNIVDGADFTLAAGGVLAIGKSALQSGGTVTVNSYLSINDGGSYTQAAGIVKATSGVGGVNGVQIGYTGLTTFPTSTYVLVNGRLEASVIRMGGWAAGAGRFTQYEGMVTNSGVTIVGESGNGYYYQHGGTNFCSGLNVPSGSATGYYSITNGALRVTDTLHVAAGASGRGEVQVGGNADVSATLVYLAYGANSQARFTLSGGTLTTPNLALSGSTDSDSLFTQTGGMLYPSGMTIPVAGSTNATMLTQGGTNSISGNVSMGYGAYGMGRWDIEGGSVSVGGSIMMGASQYGSSMLSLSGGTLSAANLMLGFNPNGTHTFTQSGGTNTVTGQFIIGRQADTDCAYHMTGGRLNASGIDIGQSWSTGTGLFHVVGMAPQVQASAYTQYGGGHRTLEVTLDQGGGIRPIEISGTATLDGVLTIGLTNNVKFELGTVLTLMTYSNRSGTFAQTNFLNGVSCRVNYLSDRITLDQLEPVLHRGTIVAVR